MAQNQKTYTLTCALRRYKGAKTKIGSGGYVWEFCPDHPGAKQGYIQQHRLVVECSLGRFLSADETIHHVDRNKKNNDLANLKVVSVAEHMRLHQIEKRLEKYPPLTEEIVRDALASGGLKAAARALGTSQCTIRNNFPDLVGPYKRKRPVSLDTPELRAKVAELAPRRDVSLAQAAELLGCSAATIARTCRRMGIEWIQKRGVERKHYNIVLSQEQIAWLREQAASKEVAQPEVAKKLGCSLGALQRVLTKYSIEWTGGWYRSYPTEDE